MATAKKARTTRKKHKATRPYTEPKTAAELGITCARCGAPAEYFDPDRGKKDHLAGFICGTEQRSPRSEKLLIRN